MDKDQELTDTIISFIKTIHGLSFYPGSLQDLKDGILFLEIMEQVDHEIFDKSQANDRQACEYNWQMIHHNLVTFRKMLSKFFKNVLEKPFEGDKTIDLLAISEKGDESEILKLSKFVVQAAVHNPEFVKNIPVLLEEKHQVSLMGILQEPVKQEEIQLEDSNNIQSLLYKIDGQEQEINNLKQQNESLLQQKLNLENNSQLLVSQVYNKDKLIEQMNLNDQNKLSAVGLSDSDDFLEAMKIKDQKIEDLSKIHEADLREKDQIVDGLKDEIQNLERKYKEVKKFEKNIHQYQELKEELIYIQDQKNNFENQFNMCQRELAEKDAYSIKINDKYKKLQEDYKSEKEISLNNKLELSSKITQLESVSSKLSEYKEKYYLEEQKALDLQSQLESFQEDSLQLSSYRKSTTLDTPLEEIMNKQEKEIEDLKKENEAQKEKINKLEQDDPEILKHEIKILNNKLKELQQENRKLEESSSFQEKSEEKERQLAKEKEKNTKLQQTILKAKETVKKYENVHLQLEQCKREKEKFEAQCSKIPKLIGDNNQLKQQIKIMEEQYEKKIKDSQDKLKFMEKQQGLEKTQKEEELTSRLLEKQDEIEKQDQEYKNQLMKLQEKHDREMQDKLEELEKEKQEAQNYSNDEYSKIRSQYEQQLSEKETELQNQTLEIQQLNREKNSLHSQIQEKEMKDSKRQSLLVEKEELLERKLQEKDAKHKNDLLRQKTDFNSLLQEKENQFKKIQEMWDSQSKKKMQDMEHKYKSQIQDSQQQNAELEAKFKEQLKQRLQESQDMEMKKSQLKTDKDAEEMENLNKQILLLKQDIQRQKMKFEDCDRFAKKTQATCIELVKSKNEEIMLMTGVLQDLRNRYQEMNDSQRNQQQQQLSQSAAIK